MKKDTKFLLFGAGCAVSVLAGGTLNTSRLEHRVESLQEQCEKENSDSQEKAGPRTKYQGERRSDPWAQFQDVPAAITEEEEAEFRLRRGRGRAAAKPKSEWQVIDEQPLTQRRPVDEGKEPAETPTTQRDNRRNSHSYRLD